MTRRVVLEVYFQVIVGAVVRGCGLQKLGSYINIVGYYVIAIPVGLILTFQYGYGLFGLWVGLTAGLMCVSSVQVIVLFRMDWNLQASNALKRVNGDSDGEFIIEEA